MVIAAGKAGKYKAVFQNLFIGASILWYALHSAAARPRLEHGAVWHGWLRFHFAFSVVVLSVAVVLTLYSLGVYLWSYRTLVAGARPARLRPPPLPFWRAWVAPRLHLHPAHPGRRLPSPARDGAAAFRLFQDL